MKAANELDFLGDFFVSVCTGNAAGAAAVPVGAAAVHVAAAAVPVAAAAASED